MNNLEIKSLSSPDIEVGGSEVVPPKQVYFLIQIEIGEHGDERRDVFQVMVTTPEALRARKAAESSVLSDRATLIVSELSWNKLIDELARIVDSCRASSWQESVLKLQRFFRWEYEGFVAEGD